MLVYILVNYININILFKRKHTLILTLLYVTIMHVLNVYACVMPSSRENMRYKLKNKYSIDFHCFQFVHFLRWISKRATPPPHSHTRALVPTFPHFRVCPGGQSLLTNSAVIGYDEQLLSTFTYRPIIHVSV